MTATTTHPDQGRCPPPAGANTSPAGVRLPSRPAVPAGAHYRRQEHTAMTEHVPGPSRAGSVVLDVGRDVGALVLHAPAAMDGWEIEISERGDPDGRRGDDPGRRRRQLSLARAP